MHYPSVQFDLALELSRGQTSLIPNPRVWGDTVTVAAVAVVVLSPPGVAMVAAVEWCGLQRPLGGDPHAAVFVSLLCFLFYSSARTICELVLGLSLVPLPPLSSYMCN